MTPADHDDAVGGLPPQRHKQGADIRPGPEHGLFVPTVSRSRLRRALGDVGL